MNSDRVTDVTDHTYKTVTRAHARAREADKEQSVTSVTPVTAHPASIHAGGRLLHCILALIPGASTGWPERELIRQLGEKLYGPHPLSREVRHG